MDFSKRGRYQLACSKCGASFLRYAAWVRRMGDRPIYCSRTCAAQRPRRGPTMIAQACLQCGKVRQYRKGAGKHKFCSRECAANAHRKHARHERRNVAYRQWQRAVIERDKRCVRCGREELGLHAHHKKSYADHPEVRYDIENGETLCADCHAAEHPGLAYIIRTHRKPCFLKTCSTCTRTFVADGRGRMYCSRRCAGLNTCLSRGGIVTCEGCGKVFLVKPSKKQGERKFCSRMCSLAWFGLSQGGRRAISRSGYGRRQVAL